MEREEDEGKKEKVMEKYKNDGERMIAKTDR